MVAMTQPRNAQEAIAQANRLQRARQIITEGYSFTQDALTNMVAICKPGELHASYFIGEHVDGTTGCDCPDACKGNNCKHEIAWGLVKAEHADELAGLEAQCARYDAEEGWMDAAMDNAPMPTTTTAQFLVNYPQDSSRNRKPANASPVFLCPVLPSERQQPDSATATSALPSVFVADLARNTRLILRVTRGVNMEH